MAGIDHLALLRLLRARLLTVSGLPTARAWENEDFAPPNPPAPYIRETFLPASDRTLATNLRQATGLVQYDLFHLRGSTIVTPYQVADAIALAFNQTPALSATAWVDHAERGRGEAEAVYFRVPVYVTWRAFAPNV
jgi:Bacteriophage related domain of unknown function